MVSISKSMRQVITWRIDFILETQYTDQELFEFHILAKGDSLVIIVDNWIDLIEIQRRKLSFRRKGV